MSFSEHSLEQIVREVLRRLREREITSEVLAETTDSSRHSPECGSPALDLPTFWRTAATGETAGQGRVLELTDRLITLATLHGKLADIDRVVTTPKAVVTPAARDELKARKITLEMAAKPPNENQTPRQLVLAVTTKFNPAPLLRSLAAAGAGIRQLTETDWKQAVMKMTRELQNSPASGVLLTDRPAAAACLANRDRAIRAAVAADSRSAKDAVESLNANLLVVDPAAHSLWALQNLLKEYAASDHREMPL